MRKHSSPIFLQHFLKQFQGEKSVITEEACNLLTLFRTRVFTTILTKTRLWHLYQIIPCLCTKHYVNTSYSDLQCTIRNVDDTGWQDTKWQFVPSAHWTVPPVEMMQYELDLPQTHSHIICFSISNTAARDIDRHCLHYVRRLIESKDLENVQRVQHSGMNMFHGKINQVRDT